LGQKVSFKKNFGPLLNNLDFDLIINFHTNQSKNILFLLYMFFRISFFFKNRWK